MKDVEFHPLARAEYFDALQYYDDRSHFAADSLRDLVEENLNLIGQFPEGLPVIDTRHQIRKCVILGFPYSVLYCTDDNHLYILAVMHNSREPEYWKDRIKDIPF